jgi:hypothetical protein
MGLVLLHFRNLATTADIQNSLRLSYLVRISHEFSVIDTCLRYMQFSARAYMLEVSQPDCRFLMEVFISRAPDFVTITGRILENASIQVIANSRNFEQNRATYNI